MDSGRFRRLLLKVLNILVATGVFAGWAWAFYEWGGVVKALYVEMIGRSYAGLAPWVGQLPAAAVLALGSLLIAVILAGVIGTVAAGLVDFGEDVEGFGGLIIKGAGYAVGAINIAIFAIFFGIPAYQGFGLHVPLNNSGIEGNTIFAAMSATVLYGFLILAAVAVISKYPRARLAASLGAAAATALFLIWEMFITSNPMRVSGSGVSVIFGASVGSWIWAYVEWNRRKPAHSEAAPPFTFGLKRIDPPN